MRMDKNHYYRKSPGERSEEEGFGRTQKRGRPVWLLIAADVFAAALLLLVFYLTNYEMHGETSAIEALPVPSWFESPSPEVTPVTSFYTSETKTVPAPAVSTDPNNWRIKFKDKFTDKAAEQTGNAYRNANINVSIEKVHKENLTYYVADIYVAELKYFKTAFAKKPDKMGHYDFTDRIAKQNNAILAISGDHCAANEGTVVRMGKVFRKPKSSFDVLVMNYDGTMQMHSPDEFDVSKTLSAGVYQVWSFGPMLVKDGQPLKQFNDTLGITGKNPRAAIGYYEPGHYCFVLVDGRQGSYSKGLTLLELAQLFTNLGCKLAYNMDGGRSAEMAFMGKLVSHPMDDRRETPDIIYIGE